MNKTIVIFGGKSEERLVSVASAQNIAHELKDATYWFESRDGKVTEVTTEQLLKHQRPFEVEFVPSGKLVAVTLDQAINLIKDSCLLIAYHGTEGEDGTFQAKLEAKKIPFTGSGSHSSQICFDKQKAKRAARDGGLAIAPGFDFKTINIETQERLNQLLKKFEKIVLKPVANGSSIGLSFVNSTQELEKWFDKATQFDHWIAEAFIKGRELTVTVCQRNGQIQALPASEVILTQGYQFDYNGKYLGKGSKEITPADLEKGELSLCQEMALEAHKILKCYGYSRTDIILSENRVIFLETNTLPGMTKASFVPQQLAAQKIPFKDFLNEQIKLAYERK